MKIKSLFLGASLAALSVSQASATVTGFVNNATGNSVDWQTSALGLGTTIETLTFDAHPTGALDPNFYAGVQLVASGDVNTVRSGAGPNDGNTSTGPISNGEGTHSGAGNYLYDGGSASSLTLNFDAPVFGAGMFVIDYFNPGNDNPLSISAYTGANGTGTLLGTFNSVAFNFQPNSLYFMGITSSDGDIGSIVYRDINSVTGDTTGIDDIKIARGSAVPDSGSTVLMLAFAGLGLGLARRHREK